MQPINDDPYLEEAALAAEEDDACRQEARRGRAEDTNACVCVVWGDVSNACMAAQTAVARANMVHTRMNLDREC